MEKIQSFKVDHEKLEPGVYISRIDDVTEDVSITTFDLRFVRPNRDEPINQSALHTIEHLGATFLRNDPFYKKESFISARWAVGLVST